MQAVGQQATSACCATSACPPKRSRSHHRGRRLVVQERDGRTTFAASTLPAAMRRARLFQVAISTLSPSSARTA